ncbi:MAG: M48 family metallopeptidase [Acidobacteriota bacterium]
MRSCVWIAGFLTLLAAGSLARNSGAHTPRSRAAVTQQTASAAEVETGPVPVPQPSEKAMRYYRSGNVLWVVRLAWGLLIPTLLLMTGFSARMRDWARFLGRKWFFIIGLYFIFFAVINFVLDLPLDYYQEFVRQHAYGLSNQTFNKWITDSLKSLLVGVVAGVLFLWVPYLLLKRSPRRWWLYTGILAVPFLFFLMLISPIWIAPLFNDFGPMKDKALEARILDLAEHAGIEGSRVYEVNKSVDTKAVNAYVSGFMGSKRIVLWDTIIAKLEPEELLFAMGHEMGHYVLGHVVEGIFFFAFLILVGLYLIYRTAGRLITRFRGRFGFDQLSDVASLPLIIVLFNIFSLLITPVALTYSRHQEHEADRFGLEITENNHAAATAFVKLQEENLGNPRPGILYKLWRSSHPTLGERVDFCNDYKPWRQGRPLKYGNLFKAVAKTP